MDPPVLTELKGCVLRIVLNRPESHNAFEETMIEGLRQAIERAAADREVRVAVLSGAGPSFCAGAHIAWMRDQGLASQEENVRSAERLARLLLAIDRLPKPVVGRIHGAVMGGGVGLASACDVVVAASNVRIALTEVRLGMVAAAISPYVVRKLGPARARELILTGRRFTGEEAVRFGLASRAVDPSLLDAAVEGVISDLLRGGPQAIARAKQILREIERGERVGDELARWTAAEMASTRAGEEARAGLTAFLEKVPPPWCAK
jgi:methylglutaconyl-CoA hydratase